MTVIAGNRATDTRPDLSCIVYVNGVRIADDGASYESGVPTVLTGLSLTWGRETNVDQPDTASLQFTVAENPGKGDLIDYLHVGWPVELYAGGTPNDNGVGVRQATNPVQVDGGFETPIANRARPGTLATIFAGPPRSGMQSLAFVGNARDQFENHGYAALIPPAPFSTVHAAWDDIPTATPGEQWNIQAWIRSVYLDWQLHNTDLPTIGNYPQIEGKFLAFFSPSISEAPTEIGSFLTTYGVLGLTEATQKNWFQLSMTFTLPDLGRPYWVGMFLANRGMYSWQNDPALGSNQTRIHATRPWNDAFWTPDITWRNFDAHLIDDMVIYAPGTAREQFEAFAGRITDLQIQAAQGQSVTCTVTAQDTTADIANDNIGDVPWPAQPVLTRVNRIRALSTIAFAVDLDDGFGALQVSYQDVDSQPVLDLLHDLAVSVDAVMWSAFHTTRGFYFWFEDPMARESLGVLEWDSGRNLVVIDWERQHPSDAVVISACRIERTAPDFLQSVSDVLTRTDATWQEQTLGDDGLPAPTERNVSVYDPSGQAQFGIRTASVSTLLTNANDCTNVATRVLLRSEGLHWRTENLTWDTALRGEFSAMDVDFLLKLLDGTRRIGLAVTVTDLPSWCPESPMTNAYLEGGTYTYNGGYWSLALNLSPSDTIGESAEWRDLLSAWRWVDFDPTIQWFQLFGVGVAGSTRVRDAQLTTIVPRPIPAR